MFSPTQRKQVDSDEENLPVKQSHVKTTSTTNTSLPRNVTNLKQNTMIHKDTNNSVLNKIADTNNNIIVI